MLVTDKRCWTEINLSAIINNYRIYKNCLPAKTKVMAVVKYTPSGMSLYYYINIIIDLKILYAYHFFRIVYALRYYFPETVKVANFTREVPKRHTS